MVDVMFTTAKDAENVEATISPEEEQTPKAVDTPDKIKGS